MIVVAGEALVDLIPTPVGDLGVNPGGGPFNTARWLGRLGADVGSLGSIAADPLGQRLRDALLEAGVALDLVVATQLPTTLAVAQLDAAGAAQYSFYTDGTSSGDLEPEQALARLPQALDALYLGGLALVLEPIATALTRAVEVARRRGAVVMVDPNVRASLIRDRPAYLERLWGVLAKTDVLKLSVEDVAWLEPGESPAELPLAAARRLLDRGPRIVLLTGGAGGATVFTADGETAIPAVAVEVVDTIGAGDAFSAGFLAYWLRDRPGLDRRGLDWRGEGNPPQRWISFPASQEREAGGHEAVVDAARFAAEVASVACAQRGATPPALAAFPARFRTDGGTAAPTAD
jgi:fructokinase